MSIIPEPRVAIPAHQCHEIAALLDLLADCDVSAPNHANARYIALGLRRRAADAEAEFIQRGRFARAQSEIGLFEAHQAEKAGDAGEAAQPE